MRRSQRPGLAQTTIIAILGIIVRISNMSVKKFNVNAAYYPNIHIFAMINQPEYERKQRASSLNRRNKRI